MQAEPSNRRLRVLVLAELANPDWESVPLVGWLAAEALSRHADVHLATHERNRENIEKSGLFRNRVTYASAPLLDDFVWNLAHRISPRSAQVTYTALQYPVYLLFERSVWKQLSPRIGAREFDIVHRLTPVSPALPSPFAARLAALQIPFVLGPINGGLPWPPGSKSIAGQEMELLSHFRELFRFLPYYGSTRRHAAAILAGSSKAWADIPPKYHHKTFYMPENAISTERFSKFDDSLRTGPLRVAFVGRLVPIKGVDILLEAAAPLIRQKKMTLDIIGDGPERGNLENKALALGISESVSFAGWIDNRLLQDRLCQASVFAFPSIREFGGAVVMEAMALGVVPVVALYGGPAEVVDDRTGLRIPVGNREQMTRDLETALRKFAILPPQELLEWRRRARKRALEDLTLARKTERTLAIYRWILSEGKEPRPNLVPPAECLSALPSPSWLARLGG